MSRQCQVCKKSEYNNSAVTFHSIPANPEKRSIWFALLGFEKDTVLPKRPYICSNHFLKNDFQYKDNGLKYLKADAAPQSVFQSSSSSNIGTDLGVEELPSTPTSIQGKNTEDRISVKFSSSSPISGRFPTNSEPKKIWFDTLGLKEGKQLPKCAEICSDHFNSSDFHTKGNGLRYINPGAISQPRSTVSVEPLERVPVNITEEQSKDMPSSSSTLTVFETQDMIRSRTEDMPISPGNLSHETEQNKKLLQNRIFKIGTISNLSTNLSTSNQEVIYNIPRCAMAPMTANEENINTDPKLVKIGSNVQIPTNFVSSNQAVRLVKIGSNMEIPTNLTNQVNTYLHNASRSSVLPNLPPAINTATIPKLIKIGTLSDLPPSFLSSLQKSGFLTDATRDVDIDDATLKNVPAVVPVPNEKVYSLIGTSRGVNINTAKIPAVGIIPYEDLCSDSDTSSDSASTDTASETKNLINATGSISLEQDTIEISSEASESSTDSAGENKSMTRLGSPLPDLLQPDIKQETILPSAVSTRLNPLGLATINDAISEGLSQKIKEETTLVEPSLVEPLRSNSVKQEDQLDEETFSAASLSDEQLIKILETDSPLNPELLLCRGSRSKRKRFFGDISINDYLTLEDKEYHLYMEKRINEARHRIKNLHVGTRRLKTKLAKISSIVNIVASVCDVSEIKRVLEGEDESCDDDITSNEDGEELSDNPLSNKSQILDAEMYEENETQIDSFYVANQVQVTFTTGNDNVNEFKLKRKLEKVARQDVIKSQKIIKLNNAIFQKNKIIDELKSELNKLKNDV